MPWLKFWNPETGTYEKLHFFAKGDKGDPGEQGPPGSAGNLNALSDVTISGTVNPGKVLGTTGTDMWGPIDAFTEGQADAKYMWKSGGNFTGDVIHNQDLTVQGTALFLQGLSANQRRITAVDDPVAGNDAATKDYADSRIWQGTQAEYDAIAPGEAGVLHVIMPG